jgi:hypothetical protein
VEKVEVKKNIPLFGTKESYKGKKDIYEPKKKYAIHSSKLIC